MSESKTFYFLITVSFPLMVGGEIGDMYTVREFQHTAKGVIRSRPCRGMEWVADDVLERVRDEAWEAYRAEHDFDRLPKENVLGKPIVLCFYLVPDQI